MMAGPWGDPKDSAPSSCPFIFHAVEVVVNRRSPKKVFLKTSQIFQENVIKLLVSLISL